MPGGVGKLNQIEPGFNQIMGNKGVGQVGPLGPGEIPGFSGLSGAQSTSFTNVLDRAIGEVDGKMKVAEMEKAKVLSGESSNLHQSMIAMQEAGVAFTLMVEMRNKLVESYQELMRMQV